MVTEATQANNRPSQAWEERVRLTKTHNIVKSLVAFLQLCFSVVVLARASGNQVDVYGYAAFSLTVAPYAVMAAVNLLANACMPSYDSLYLVGNDVLDEIVSLHGLRFDGLVGNVKSQPRVSRPSPLTFAKDGETLIGVRGTDQLMFGVLTPNDAAQEGVDPAYELQIEPCQQFSTAKQPAKGEIDCGLMLVRLRLPASVASCG